ncbi:MauE/DoxX family redox-associated membrane protein [Flavobacterium sp. TMP13]|uniref:MauE/DoxX family redox-associated membrane protein n=1 Tax=Flavobacterium sp. TMP13 TaxID=3425950 RepID=UPI003D7756EB
MSVHAKIRNLFIEGICLLFVLLFVYAAVSKLLDFENFKVQLGQSPLLSSFAEYVSWGVPVLELSIVVLLIVPKFRFAGLFAAFSLMVMFTTYIIIILNYSSFVPCSCGGILEKMSWKEHLIFNFCFLLLAVVGMLLFKWNQQNAFCSFNSKLEVGVFCTSTFCSISLVVVLFLLSENNMHYRNDFIRRFPHFPAVKAKVANLPFNSFYIAGIADDKLYLGSTSAQLLLTVLDSNLQKKEEYHIELDHKELPFRALTVQVDSPYFYVSDGTVPCVFKGKIGDWKAHLVNTGNAYFTLSVPIDSTALIVRALQRGTAKSIIGRMNLLENSETLFNSQILEEQIDGLFDTDGHLVYSKKMKRFIYLYAYRNQFTVVDRNLMIDFRGKTIDSIGHAKLEVVTIPSHGVRKLRKPALVVNKACAVFDNLLFVNSEIMGRYESIKMWKSASIIDLYNLSDNSYLLSFYLYDEEGKKMKSFAVQNNQLYALIGNQIVRYTMGAAITAHYSTTTKK